MRDQWQDWAWKGFGNAATVSIIEAKLEAGSRQDGTPPEQLIMCAPLRIHDWPVRRD
jgi:hypothetical protein